jgi:hypothetical protein
MDYKLLLLATLFFAASCAGVAEANARDTAPSGATAWAMLASMAAAGPVASDLGPKMSRGARIRHMGAHRMTIAVLGWVVFFALSVSRHRPPRVALALAAGLSGLAVAYLLLTASTGRYEAERQLHITAVFAFAVLPLLATAAALSPRLQVLRAATPGWTCATAALIAGAGAVIYALGVAAIHGTQQPAIIWAVAAGAALAMVLVSVLARAAVSGQQRLHRAALVGITLGSVYALVHFNPQGSLVLLHDQFHYFLGAKYFQELGYTRLYHCAAIAEMDNGRGELIAQQRIRDLMTNRLVPGDALLADPHSCRSAFSARRWEAFRSDVAYFRTHTSAHGAQNYLKDHGYNASPAWTALNRAMIASRPASNTTVRWLSSIDVALLLGMFALLVWAFGAETAVLAALLWGTSSIWMYEGQGGIGSFGRLYWVFAVLAAVCLSKKGWSGVAGFSLAVAVMDRLFPVAFLFGPIAAAAGGLVKRRSDRRLWRMLAGATLGVTLIASYTFHATDGLQTVNAFVENSRNHVSRELINNVGLSTLVSSSWVSTGQLTNYQWTQLRKQNLARRYAAFLALAATALVMTAWVCWVVREPWKMLIVGLLPMFAMFSLTNYYYAVLVLLAPLAGGRLLHMAVLIGSILVAQVVHQQTWPELAFALYSVLVPALLLYFMAALALDSKRDRKHETDRPVPSALGTA